MVWSSIPKRAERVTPWPSRSSRANARQRAQKWWSWAVCTSSAQNATSRDVSTISCAVVPDAKVIRGKPVLLIARRRTDATVCYWRDELGDGSCIARGCANRSADVLRAIEKAQNTVEQKNAEVRKDVLKYDEVMNEQRKVIYERRMQILEGEDLREHTIELLATTCARLVSDCAPSEYAEEWDLERLIAEASLYYPTQFSVADL